MIVSRHRGVLVNTVLGQPPPEIEDVHAKRFRQLPDADEASCERRQRVTLPEGQVVHRHLVAREDSVAHELPLAGLAGCREAGKLVVGGKINLHRQGCVMRHLRVPPDGQDCIQGYLKIYTDSRRGGGEHVASMTPNGLGSRCRCREGLDNN